MDQKIDNIYRSYKNKDNEKVDDILFDLYEIILAKLDDESLEDI